MLCDLGALWHTACTVAFGAVLFGLEWILVDRTHDRLCRSARH